MRYKINPKNGDNLPVLGFGGLRYPKIDNHIDKDYVVDLVKKALELGINHFDTAYSYEGSEEALGFAISKLNIRNKVTISTKLPISLCKRYDDFDKYFFESLKRIGVDYVDYYFIHALNTKGRFDQLIEWGLLEWIREKKELGLIKNIGFSSHASYKEYEKIIDAYEWEFTMIQYNYIDTDWQAGEKGLEIAEKKGIPMFIMEPLRGGLLANKLPKEAMMQFDSLCERKSYGAWALRYVLNKNNVQMVLSGMNEINQIYENCNEVDNSFPNCLSELELLTYEKAAKEIHSKMDVYCTSCGYCMPCPRGVSIPSCMNRLNSSRLIGIEQAKKDFEYHDGNAKVLNCISCGLCKQKCPQKIDIPNKIQLLKERFDIK